MVICMLQAHHHNHHQHLCLNVRFPGEPRPASSSVFSPPVPKRTYADNYHRFYEHDALPVTHQTVSKHVRKIRALTLTKANHPFFIHHPTTEEKSSLTSFTSALNASTSGTTCEQKALTTKHTHYTTLNKVRHE